MIDVEGLMKIIGAREAACSARPRDPVVEADRNNFRRLDWREQPMRAEADRVAGLMHTEQLAFEQPPAAVPFDATRLSTDLDPESFHRAVSSSRADGALLFGGAALSTATIAYAYRTPGFAVLSS
jgi:hypothetical protein